MDQVLANGLVLGCLYALVAYGFGLIYNTTRTFHFAHGGIYIFCVYLLYLFKNLLSLPLWWAIAFSLMLTVLLGVLVDEVVYQPLVKRKSSLLLQMLSSLAAYTIIINLISLFYGNESRILNLEIQKTFTVGTVVLTQLQIISVICAVLLVAVVAIVLRVTRLGTMTRAFRDDAELMGVLGVNPRHLRWFVFGLGSALAGVAAVLQGLDVGTNPEAGLLMFLNGAVAVIVGGKGIIEAGILGALVVGFLQSLTVWTFSPRWEESATFLLLVIFLLVRPEGVFGRLRRTEEIES